MHPSIYLTLISGLSSILLQTQAIPVKTIILDKTVGFNTPSDVASDLDILDAPSSSTDPSNIGNSGVSIAGGRAGYSSEASPVAQNPLLTSSLDTPAFLTPTTSSPTTSNSNSAASTVSSSTKNTTSHMHLPPVASGVKANLLGRLSENFNISLPSSVHKGLVTQCDKDIALSYDDGAYKWGAELDAEYALFPGARMTRFVNGNPWGTCIYDEASVKSIRASFDAGHLIASHTYSHAHLNSLTHDEIDEEIESLELALWKIIGAVPAIIRPPYGEANDDVVQYLNNKHGLTVTNWDIDSGDSAGATPAASISTLSTFKYPEPHLPLMHETYQTSVVNVTSEILPLLRKQGYKMLTVSQCLSGVPGYKLQGKRQERDETWTCDGQITYLSRRKLENQRRVLKRAVEESRLESLETLQFIKGKDADDDC